MKPLNDVLDFATPKVVDFLETAALLSRAPRDSPRQPADGADRADDDDGAAGTPTGSRGCWPFRFSCIYTLA